MPDEPDIAGLLRGEARIARERFPKTGILVAVPPELLDRAADEIERLRREALRYYRGDGTFDVLGSPEEVVRRRIEAAKKLEAPG